MAGPIENPRNLMPQLRAVHRLNWDDFTAGARLLLCGFFRKCVVADVCGIYVNRIFGNLEDANALAILCAAGLFSVQIYCDFAGYSEIAAGCARMMGVRLMRNFDRPFLSQSVTELFRRWHISLNQWFTSYVYIPLGGGRKGKRRKLLNILIVFTLCGLWHGARWTYVLWGLYAAFFLCLEDILDIRHRFGPKWDTPLGKLLRRCCMFIPSLISALLFRSESVEQLGLVFTRLVTQTGFGGAYFQYIQSGGDVVFLLTMDSGYSLAETDYDGDYHTAVNGRQIELTLEDVLYYTRVTLRLTSSYCSITYLPNGGTGRETTVEYDTSNHLRPNTSTGVKLFSREGYTLVGWNTRPDGTGERIGLGSRASLNATGLTLYAQWAKWSNAADFAYRTDGETITVTGYHGSDSVVVVPAAIDGREVTAIASGAFCGSAMTGLVLPVTMQTVETSAFQDCALKTVTLYDNIESIKVYKL